MSFAIKSSTAVPRKKVTLLTSTVAMLVSPSTVAPAMQCGKMKDTILQERLRQHWHSKWQSVQPNTKPLCGSFPADSPGTCSTEKTHDDVMSG